MKEVILTAEGHDKLKEEIEHLSTVKRREVAERIKQAREFGDIAETPSTTTRRTSRPCSSTASPCSRSGSRALESSPRTTRRRVSSPWHEGAAARHGRQGDDRVPRRRLGRGEPRRAQALQRIAGRQGDHGKKKGEIVEVAGAARLPEVQDHGGQQAGALPKRAVPGRPRLLAGRGGLGYRAQPTGPARGTGRPPPHAARGGRCGTSHRRRGLAVRRVPSRARSLGSLLAMRLRTGGAQMPTQQESLLRRLVSWRVRGVGKRGGGAAGPPPGVPLRLALVFERFAA